MSEENFMVTQKREQGSWSYTDFLITNCDIIVVSLLYLNNYTSLNGTWTKRFLTSVRELYPEFADHIERKAEQERTPDFYQFWNDLMDERLKVRFGNYTIKRHFLRLKTLESITEGSYAHLTERKKRLRASVLIALLCSNQIPLAEAKK
ncbi:9429_t:CDS:2, partial [Dentiscutata erythropus]